MPVSNEKNANNVSELAGLRAVEKLFLFSLSLSFIAGLSLFSQGNIAFADEEVPEPLTLEYALSQADNHPQLAPFATELEISKSRVLQSQASDDLDISLNGRLQWIGPSEFASDQTHDDHKISLNAEKTIYDFGRNETRTALAGADVQSDFYQLDYQLGIKRIDIMRRYFDVLLADLEFAAENEAIAIAFIRADRLQQKAEFGEASELEVLEEQSAYQSVLSMRTAAELKQRSSRALLAEAINKPGKLSEVLLEPELTADTREVPEYQELLDMALANHAGIQSLKERLQGSETRLDVSRLQSYPTLKAYAEIADYSRTESGSDEWTLGLRVKVPLYQGGRTDADFAQAKSQADKIRAELSLLQAQTRQNVLELWQKLRLLKVELQQAVTELDARDLYLDKSRALYDLSVRSDLGDAMIRFSRARLQHAKILYEMAITWAMLDLYSGGKLPVKTENPG